MGDIVNYLPILNEFIYLKIKNNTWCLVSFQQISALINHSEPQSAKNNSSVLVRRKVFWTLTRKAEAGVVVLVSGVLRICRSGVNHGLLV